MFIALDSRRDSHRQRRNGAARCKKLIPEAHILWISISIALVVLMQSQALRLAWTNRKLAESEQGLKDHVAELNERNDRLRELDVIKTRLITGASHDLKLPTDTIVSCTRIIRTHADHEETVSRFAEVVATEAHRLSERLTELLDHASPDWRSRGIVERKTAPSTIVEHAVASAGPVAHARGVSLEPVIETDLSTVWVDEERLIQAFVLLLDNAIQQSDPGTNVRCSVSRQGPEIVFVVEDQGQEISAAQMESIFDEIPRDTAGCNAESDGRHRRVGLGLGLCSQIVQRHNGRIWARNTDSGVAFSIALSPADYEPRTADYV